MSKEMPDGLTAKELIERAAMAIFEVEEDSVFGIGQCLEHRQSYEQQDENRKHWLRHKARAALAEAKAEVEALKERHEASVIACNECQTEMGESSLRQAREVERLKGLLAEADELIGPAPSAGEMRDIAADIDDFRERYRDTLKEVRGETV